MQLIVIIWKITVCIELLPCGANNLIEEIIMFRKVLFSVVAVLLLATTAYSDDKAVEYVKAQKLKVCTRMTVGQLIARNVNRPYWESGTSSKGDILVEVTGTIGPAGERMSYYSQFKINMRDGGFTTTAMKLDGTPLNHDQMIEIFQTMCR